MARFLGMLKVSNDEAARMIHDGPRARRDFVDGLVRGAGGVLEGFWLTNVGDWDLICIVNMADETPISGAAATLARRAAGFADSERWIELADVDDVAQALEKMAHGNAT